jgi:hypothetical protein
VMGLKAVEWVSDEFEDEAMVFVVIAAHRK